MNKVLKAYLINNTAIYKDRDDVEGFICFHYSAKEAKKNFWSSFESGLDTYLDNRVLRAKCFDKYLNKEVPYILDIEENYRAFYQNLWPQSLESFQCSFCERHEYKEIEDSKIGCYENDLCINCLKDEYIKKLHNLE